MSPGEMIAVVKANMLKKTGKTFEQWVKLARAKGPSTPKECYAWLKKKHGVPHLSAQLIADKASGQGVYDAYEDPDALVDAMYAGPMASLRPIYERMLKLARKLGKDVVITPCKSYVGFRRKRQFAIVKPRTPTRVDLGFTLANVKPRGRLEALRKTSSDRISHVIKVESPKDIDAEVKGWLTKAYKRDA
jgi:hypothetical protein